MNYSLPEFRFLIAFAIGVIVPALVIQSPAGYAAIILLLIFILLLFSTRTWHDRGFYLVCCGEPVVIACSMMNIWAGLFASCMLAGIVCGALGLVGSGTDFIPFAGFCISSLVIAMIIHFSNHVLLPLTLIIAITAIILAIQSVRIYQFRKQYSGA